MGSRRKRLVSSDGSGLDIALLQARRREPNRGSQVSRAKPGATLSPLWHRKANPSLTWDTSSALPNESRSRAAQGATALCPLWPWSPGAPPYNPNSEDCDRCDE